MKFSRASRYILTLTFFYAALAILNPSIAQNRISRFLPKENDTLKYLYGLSSMEWDNPLQEAAKKFGYSHYRIGGCVLPENLRRHAQKHNKKLEQRLIKKHGTNWKENYNQEIERLYSLFRYSDTIIMHSQVFGDQYPEIPEGKIPFHYFQETAKDSILLVSICDVDHWINNKLVIYRQFELNIISKEVKLIGIEPDKEAITIIKR